jgi:histidine triad (HIT) family protein
LSYDDNNVFAKILRDELPSERVYEDEQTLVMMDIMPRADGHVLVIPKTPARNMLDASPEQLASCMASIQKVSHAMMKAFDAPGITIQQFNEVAGGQEVFHLHFHVLPRHEDARLRPPGNMEKPDVIKANADKIRAALATMGHA